MANRPPPLRRSSRLRVRPAFDIQQARLPHILTRQPPDGQQFEIDDNFAVVGGSTNEEVAAERPAAAAITVVHSLATTTVPHDASMPMLGIARRPTIEYEVQPHFLGHFSNRCSKCYALHWSTELSGRRISEQSFLTCCHHGKVSIPLLQQPPPPLYDLYTSNTATAKTFRQNIVSYNAALAFTSLGVNVDHTLNAQAGPPIFRIHGELMHWSGSLLPDNGTPSYAQLYIYDPQRALQYRMSRNATLDEEVMSQLQQMIIAHNRYHSLYLHAYEILRDSDTPDYTVRLVTLPGHDERRNQLPTADEVAIILPDSPSTVESTSRDIILCLRRSIDPSSPLRFPLQRISEGHAAYAPTHYVLLFPHGEAGWHWDLFHTTGCRKLSLCQYVAFRLHPRGEDIEFSTILRGGRLLHHYIVDMYACIDQSRLLYHRTHQHEHRLASASGMHDALHPSDDVIANQISLRQRLTNIGQKIILPSSYVGGPRNMYERYQDGMAIARHYKQMDLFITMTANPNWREIHEALLPGQSAHDRPDIIARVFHEKHKHFLHAVMNDMIFGKCLAYVYTVEFQKRGLPHCHYLFVLASPYKLLTADAVDSVISASWPNPDNDPLLFEIVKRHMIHGPCGALNPHAPCMVDGKCSKGYPKPFQQHTFIDIHGYPLYERQNDGRRYEVGHHFLDNHWVVPFNAYILKRYVAHINTECTISFGSLAYILKYFKKLRDTGTLQLRNKDDEIERYISGRYFSAIEAAWHAFEFEIHGQKPSVVQLPIHLPFQEPVIYDSSEPPNVLELRSHLENTSLMAFFHANADTGDIGVEARKHTYVEFPQHFVLKTCRSPGDSVAKKYWDIRKQNFALGRIAFVKPSSGERFYLRMLLLQVKGATSFNSLKEWPPNSGQIHPTFYDACCARGLLEDDNEWRICLDEASQMKTGAQLRHLFTILLLFCDVSQPQHLWEQFKDHLCNDLLFRLQSLFHYETSTTEIYDYGLYLIDCSLQDSGHHLSDFPSMPQVERSWNTMHTNPWIAEQTAFDRQTEAAIGCNMVSLLNVEQSSAFHAIYNAVMNNHPSLFFLNGPAGTGKTFVYKALCHSIRSKGFIVICVASTGIAALLLPKGRTAHSVFKIPITTLAGNSVCSITKDSLIADLLRNTRLIIWDECVMAHRWIVEAVDRTLQDIRNDTSVMGGITSVLGGDWNQCLPVVERGSREDIVNACFQRSYLWPSTTILKLSTNMRLSSAVHLPFANWLTSIGNGSANDANGHVILPSTMLTYSSDHLLQFVYADVFGATVPPSPSYFLSRCIIAPQHTTVDDINDIMFSHFPGTAYHYIAADCILSDDDPQSQSSNIGSDDLQAFNLPNFPPANLALKIHCPLILLRNLNPSQGLCNGTRLVLLAVDDRVLEVLILTGDHANEHAFIPRISLYPQSSPLPFNFRRRQFPVQLCFAMTINKSEGQTFETVGIDLRHPVFSHGQLYVALSRATTPLGIHILLSPTSSSELTVPNVIYPEVLLS